MTRKNWYPLDNAAKIYPPNTDRNSPFVFSFSALLSEEVEPELLQKAAEFVLTKTPTFKTRLKRGIFWYYLEENNKPVIVKPQPANYLKTIENDSNNGFMFELFYREKTVTINFHHSITDGTGGVNFFLELLFEYFRLCGYDIESEGLLRPSAAPYVIDESEDNFRKFDRNIGKMSMFEENAYRFRGTPYNYDGCGIITGKCPIEQVKAAAKKYDTTITVYLAAIYMYALFESFIKSKPVKNKHVKILVPMNLRKRFSSNTVRNFALFVRLKHDFAKEITFDECMELCKTQMAEGMKIEVIEKMIHTNVILEKNVLMKIVPLFLKDIAMKLSYARLGENLQSGDLSNIGLLKTPECFTKYLKAITFLIGPTASAQHNIGVIGYNGELFITATRGYVENYLERAFFRRLSQDGITLSLESNYWEAEL